VEDETGRPHLQQPKRPTIDESVTANLRTFAGANESAAAITGYRADLAQFVSFNMSTNCARSARPT